MEERDSTPHGAGGQSRRRQPQRVLFVFRLVHLLSGSLCSFSPLEQAPGNIAGPCSVKKGGAFNLCEDLFAGISLSHIPGAHGEAKRIVDSSRIEKQSCPVKKPSLCVLSVPSVSDHHRERGQAPAMTRSTSGFASGKTIWTMAETCSDMEAMWAVAGVTAPSPSP